MASRKKKDNIRIFAVLFIVAVLLAIAVLTGGRPSREKADLEKYFASEEEEGLAVVLDGTLTHRDALVLEDAVYLSPAFLAELNPRFYLDEEEKLLLYTLPEETLRADLTTQKNGKAVLKSVKDQLYVLLDYAAAQTQLNWKLVHEPDRLVLRTVFGSRDVLEAGSAAALRERADIYSPILKTLSPGEQVDFLSENNGWYRVLSEDGLCGFVNGEDGLTLQSITEEAPVKEPEYRMVSTDPGQLLVWHQVRSQEDNEAVGELTLPVMGVTVLSPTWFHLTDGKGNFENLASESYTETAHAKGMKVWALVNNMDNEVYGSELTALLCGSSRRQKLAEKLVKETLKAGADGINVDIESLPAEAARGYVQFIRELSLACHREGLVLSVDNFVPSAWTAYYDRKEQGIFADYIIVMAYDEHYAGSEAGSTASLSFVTQGVENSLKEVPAEKLICGIPFYTRLWRGEKESVSSSLLNMTAVQEYLERYSLEPVWDISLGQYYVEFTLEDQPAALWLEDLHSQKARLEALKEYHLAGLAAWRLGMEIPEVWPLLAEFSAAQP